MSDEWLDSLTNEEYDRFMSRPSREDLTSPEISSQQSEEQNENLMIDNIGFDIQEGFKGLDSLDKMIENINFKFNYSPNPIVLKTIEKELRPFVMLFRKIKSDIGVVIYRMKRDMEDDYTYVDTKKLTLYEDYLITATEYSNKLEQIMVKTSPPKYESYESPPVYSVGGRTRKINRRSKKGSKSKKVKMSRKSMRSKSMRSKSMRRKSMSRKSMRSKSMRRKSMRSKSMRSKSMRKTTRGGVSQKLYYKGINHELPMVDMDVKYSFDE
jgi:hypothetical protein